MEEKKHCKWYEEEFCTNDKSPCVADFCPVVEYPELCMFREIDLANVVNDLANDDTDIDAGVSDEELKKAFFILRHGSSEGRSAYVKAVLVIENAYNRQKEENEYLKQCADTFLDDCERERKQAVKDTAKEILEELWNETEATENDEWVRAKIKEIAKRKGIEVE